MNKATVCINGGNIEAEVAGSVITRSLGLSFKKIIKGNEGMLFIFPLATRPIFWNFGVRFPIDVVWIRDFQIIGIEENIPAMQRGLKIFTSRDKTDAVLELVAGSVKRLGLDVCDKIDIVFHEK